MKAPLPPNEVERLNALRDYHLLDTEPEQDYDDLVRLAARICGTAIATVALIDRDRQWFKAAVGTTTRETPRDVAFCAHTILKPDEMLVVPDATRDVRFSSNPLVTGAPRIRFYAGVPLRAATGEALGSVCVIDSAPKILTADQLDSLAVIARQVNRLMDLRLASAKLARALAEVKVLEGLLPTCCHCKAIRDEQGRWQPMELYVMERTRSKFSHGICPDCARRLYPDYDLSSGDGSKRAET